MARGRLRIYLGAAPGVGKTYAMLAEGHRRAERGKDVVVGFVEDHGRPLTASMTDGLEVLPRKFVEYRGATFTEFDVDGLIERKPGLALIDELAHTNVPGSANEKRWQDIQQVLDAGIDVISTVNIQHLESVNDVVERITRVPQRETVPDEVVRAADQVDLVDMSPEALRRRMAHGNIYPAERIDASLSNYFRVGNLTALRELALLWVADKVDEGLQQYRAEQGIDSTWEARERVVVALTGGPEGDTLIRRAARIAARASGGELLALHIVKSDGLAGSNPAAVAAQRALVESLGGTFHQVVGDDVAKALLEFARAENATQLVLGASRRSRIATFLTGPGIGNAVIRDSGNIDVHMVTHDEVGRGYGLPRVGGGLTWRRRFLGLGIAVVLPTLLALVMHELDEALNATSQSLVMLVAVVLVALVGGMWPALFAALMSTLLLNFYFVEPLNTFLINDRDSVIALVVFVAVAAAVSAVVDLEARRTREAARATAESVTLATMAGSVLRGQGALDAVLERIRESFGMTSVSLLEHADELGASNGEGVSQRPGGTRWTCVASVGPAPCLVPETGDTDVPINDTMALVLRGRTLPAADRRVLGALASQAAMALEQQRLSEAAASAVPLAAADKLRTALLAAVGHDLRTPLASAKASVTSLRSGDVTWTPEEEAELLATADESLDSLARLVDNLLDLSRLQAGAMRVHSDTVGLDEVVALALDELGAAGRGVKLDLPAGLPAVRADAALLERVVANVLSNAIRHSPPGRAPLVTASGHADRVEIRIIDRGPGIAPEYREQVFEPFQRLGDTDNTTGIGLGLALSRGLTEAMDGTLVPEETPGGGLTMVISLPRDTSSGDTGEFATPTPGRREIKLLGENP